MIFGLLIALTLGILAGTFTGLSPGIHINLIASILLGHIIFYEIEPILLVIFIVSMSITHTFIDFIPSIYLGAPEEDTFLSILPGHQFFLEGKAYEATVLTLYGSIFALIVILFYTPIFIIFLPKIYLTIKSLIPFILIFISSFIIIREKEIISSLIVFIISGFLGYVAFNAPLNEPLMPLLTGLFGLSSLITSIQSKNIIIKQKIIPLKEIKLSKVEFKRAAFASFLSSPLCSFLPGIGSGHAATLGSEIVRQTRKSFLFLVGSINTIIMALSFVTVFAIDRARSGSAYAIQEILKNITQKDLTIILITILISALISFYIGILISKNASLMINKINYKKISILVISFLIIVNFIFSNIIGIMVLIISTSIGMYCIISKVRRINLMGSLILPTIIFYLTN